MTSIGALGYARVHALGALAGNSSEAIGSGGSATVRNRSENLAIDVSTETVALKLGLDIRTKAHRDALYLMVKSVRRHELGQDLATQCSYIKLGKTPLVRSFFSMKQITRPWVVLPGHPALLLKVEVGPAMARSLVRSVERAELVKTKLVYLSVPTLYSDMATVY